MTTTDLSKVAVAKGKIYAKGTLNIPKNILEVAGIKPGNEVLLQAKPDEIRIRRIKTPKELMGALPVTGTVENVFPFQFRGAFGDAMEFFEQIKQGLPNSEDWEVGNFYGKIYLKPKDTDIRTTIHFSYFEDPNYPEGAITVDGGIKQFLRNREEIAKVDENLEKINQALQRLGMETILVGENGYLIKVAPEFEIDEAVKVALLLGILAF